MSDLKTNLQSILNEKTTKIIPENIKKDVTIFNITGTYEGSGGGTVEGIKQFATVEEMNNSTGNKEGDLAVVYGSGYVPFQKNTKAQIFYFPSEVTLPEAISGDFRVMLEGSNVYGECYITSTSFGLYLEDSSISYTSEDGQHYTRTDTLEEVIDAGVELSVSMPEYYWTDYFGYFCKIEGKLFNGIYEYQNYTDKLAVNAPDLSTFTYDSSTPSLSASDTVEVDINDIEEYLNLIDFKNVGWTNFEVLLTSDKVYILPIKGSTSFTMPYYNTSTNKLYYCASAHYSKSTDKYQSYFIGDPTVKVIDKATKTLTEIDLDTVTEFGYVDTYSFSYESTMKIVAEMPLASTTHSLSITYDPDTDAFTYFYVRYGSYINSGNKLGLLKGETTRVTFTYTRGYVDKIGYLLAETQLTAMHSDVYKQSFYGSQGVQEGTLGNRVSKDLNDIANELYTKLALTYQDFTPIKASEMSSNYSLSSMYSIPVNYDMKPLIDLSEATSCSGMFSTWNNLTAVPKLDLSNATNIQHMFQQCPQLKHLAAFEIPKVTSMSTFVSNCPSLTNESLNNVMATILTATSYTGTKTFAYIGMTEDQAERCKNLSNYQNCIDAGWTTGY